MQNNDNDVAQQDRRTTTRGPLGASVQVRFDQTPVVGPGQNVSDEGVFFVADTSLPVKVRMEEGGDWVDGEVVRVQSMGEGKIGMAVKFV